MPLPSTSATKVRRPKTVVSPRIDRSFRYISGGGLIAVNYEARGFGIKRGMRGHEAKALHPDLHVFLVPDTNGKADLTRYREASAEVFKCIQSFIEECESECQEKNLIILERASIDEAFLDFTKYIDTKPLSLPDEESLNTFHTKLEMGSSILSDLYATLEEADQVYSHQLRLLMGAHLMGRLRQYILGNDALKTLLDLLKHFMTFLQRKHNSNVPQA